MHLKQEGGIEPGRKILGKLVLGDGRLEIWVCVGGISWRGVYK